MKRRLFFGALVGAVCFPFRRSAAAPVRVDIPARIARMSPKRREEWDSYSELQQQVAGACAQIEDNTVAIQKLLDAQDRR